MYRIYTFSVERLKVTREQLRSFHTCENYGYFRCSAWTRLSRKEQGCEIQAGSYSGSVTNSLCCFKQITWHFFVPFIKCFTYHTGVMTVNLLVPLKSNTEYKVQRTKFSRLNNPTSVSLYMSMSFSIECFKAQYLEWQT